MDDKDYYKGGALNPEEHKRLVAQIEFVRDQANIPMNYITHKTTQFAEEAEINWMLNHKSFVEDGTYGLVFENTNNTPKRMMGIVGMCVKNYIDARYMDVHSVIGLVKSGQTPTCSVLAVPNFFLPKEEGGNVASWDIPHLVSLLLERMAEGKTTLLYVQNMKLLKLEYGSYLHSLADDNYHIL